MTNGSKLDAFIQEIDVSGWDNLPPDKRLEILQRFENVMAESEQRDALKINVISEEEYRKSPGTMGYFDGKSININPRFLIGKGMVAGTISNFSIAKALGTIAHEGRHAWQHYVVDHPEKNIVDEKTRNKIMMNIVMYCSPSDDEDEPLLDISHTLYEAQLIELDARRFQKQVLQYISQKMEEKKGVKDRTFEHAVRQCIARERNETVRLLKYFEESDLAELEQSFKESFKKQTGIDAFDDPELSMFDDALEFLRTKDQYSFVEGKPIQKVCGYSEKEKIDSFKERDTLNKPKVRYRGTKKFK